MQGNNNSLLVHLVRLLADEETIEEFEHWFVPATWDREFLNPCDAELAATIDLRLAEYTNGHLSEAELRRHLAAAINPVLVDTRATRIATGSASVTSSQFSAAGRSRVVASW